MVAQFIEYGYSWVAIGSDMSFMVGRAQECLGKARGVRPAAAPRRRRRLIDALAIHLRARHQGEPRRMSGLVGAEQVLYWVDINAPSLNRFDPATGRNTAMPMPESIGCFALRESAASSSRCATASGSRTRTARSSRKVADAPYDPAHHRFNDGRCDPQGRFFAGSMNERRDAPAATLYASIPISR